MNYKRYFTVAPNVQLDSDFCLYYGHNRDKILEPCKEILDPNIVVKIVDNRKIKPKRLMLVDKDMDPIKVRRPDSGEIVSIEDPGKSAFMDLAGNLSGKALLNKAMENLGGVPDRRDFLHSSTVQKINEVDWHVFWAPLQTSGHILHVRMVAGRTLNEFDCPTIFDAERLASAFKLDEI